MEPNSLIVNGQILLYGDVGLTWFGDGFTPEQVAVALADLGPGDVTVRINSGGGVAFDGVAIYALLKAHEGSVTIAVDGIAASAASLIAMAGDRIEMRRGAMMMIHDAAGVTFGDAAAHEKSADTLDKLSAQYASVYAARSGKPAEDIRALMKDETWFGADEAVGEGFATHVIDDEAAPVAAFDYSVYARAPDALPRVARVRKSTAAFAAIQKEQPMAGEMNTPASGAQSVVANAEPPAAVKAWATAAYAIAEKAGLDLKATNVMVQAAASLDAFKDSVIDAVAARQAIQPDPNGARAVVTVDGRDKYVAGVSQAILAQGGVAARDGGNEFNGMKPMDIVRDVLARTGIKSHRGQPIGRDPMKMVAAAITHSSSDFPLITANVAEKAMLKGYEETEETFQIWTSVGNLSDFKQARRVDLNAMPSLPKLTEGGEYKMLTTGERGEVVSLVTAGGMVTVTRQLIINDDLNAFMVIPRRLGRAAKRTVGNDVYGVLNTNPNMGDGVALFHAATHKNLATGGGSALSATSLQAADLAMGTQKDRSNPDVTLGIKPKYILVPRALKYTARQVLLSASALGQSNPAVINPVQNAVDEIVDEARLDTASATAWYLAADQNATDTVEIQYLNGVQEPLLEQAEEFDVDGMKFKVRLDYGVKALAWEGLYRAAGA
jgi:ATP-dependent protease ClpP protease subunit